VLINYVKLVLRNLNWLLYNKPVNTFSAGRCSQRAIIVVNFSKVYLLQESPKVNWTFEEIFMIMDVIIGGMILRVLFSLNFVKKVIVVLAILVYFK